MGEVNEYPVKTSEALGASLTYSKEEIKVGNEQTKYYVWIFSIINWIAFT